MNLNQITVPSLDLTKSIPFYEKLGLQLIVKALPHYARFECPDGESTFSIHQVKELPKGDGVYVYFECENLDDYVDGLKAKGIKFHQDPIDQTWLWREARLKDVDGNQLILFYGGENRLNPPWRLEDSKEELNEEIKTDNWLSPTTLKGNTVDLIPLQIEHKAALLSAAENGQLWELWYTSVPSKDNIQKYLDTALEQQQKGLSLPFVVVRKEDNKIIGTTRYCNIDSANKRIEIGYTWYAKDFQRTGVNTECKYLLLKNAFENLDTIAIEFKTNWHNHQSRNAILRIGAKQDGVLRSHRVDKDGCLRDTVVFSIIKSEWKIVKKALEFQINKYKT